MDPPTITPYFYEPLCSATYTDTMEYAYDTVVVEFLKNWHNVSMLGESYPTAEKFRWNVLWSFGYRASVREAKNSLFFTKPSVLEDNAAIMRLRIMWMILS
ncbi:hypothetical protein PHMEG_00027515 [Phytophthora megakarya]|uniref:Uncharacterized protein n=1 Tax=Phytophthora megakarya TaxID=4795 RepID=A0A225V8C7_9STRA|nr:hypothetical protein PHMEG_00027515 [Phytophthora megakarya]